MNDAKPGPTILTSSRRWALGAVAAAYLAVAVVVLSQIDARTLSLAASLPVWLILSLLGLSLGNYVLGAGRWGMLSRGLGSHLPPLANTLYRFRGYSLTATPGEAGEAIRLWLMKSGHGIVYSRSMPVMLADRVLDIWASMLLT